MAAAEAVVQNDERLAARRAKLAAAQAKRSANAIEQGGVWVEKYRPKRYTELLGDDRTHRDVMSWLKSWDACVYKRKAKKHARDEIHTGASSYGSGYHARRTEAYSDAWNRPEQRILLLSGPPGLGKTTLAHVIANSCGYAVHELNASDARNSAAIEDRVKVALESGAALGDHRPTCVVIDEIDGATGGTGEGPSFIKSLVRLVEVGNALDAANKGKGKKKKQQRPLLRPIICICNDLYAPALRPLRPLARLVRVGKPAANHLVARLRTVCEAEGLSTDTRALNLLAELTDCDVRSCLNALQLAKAQGNTLEASQVRDKEGNGLAVKDGGSSTAKVFELLFRTPTPKERARGVGAKDGHETMSRIVDEVTSCGEQERLLHGCFEHYPTLRLVDDGFLRFKKIHDWMAWNEAVHAKGWELATHELAGYLPWAFAPWHFLFANTANELPGFAKVDYQNHLKRTAFDEIAAELYTSLPPGLRIMFGKEAVVTELGPSLMRMLSPDLRPINAQITRPGEKEILAAVVQILISLGLSLQQDRTEEGQLIMRLEPALDAFVQYEGKRSKEVGPARYAIRSAIAKEVEAVKMRIKSLSVSAGMDAMGQPVRHEELAAKAAAGAIAVYKNGGDSALLDSGALFSSALTTTTTTTTRKVAVDFFGRKILPAAAPLAPVAPDKLAEIQSDQAAIRETEAQVAKKKAAAAQQAAPLPSLLLERRAARAAAEGAANPHVRLPPASGAAPDAKRQRLQAA
ncbi:P-loop containing nucleoside triphosphate hydrolase protein [Ceraceosorus guamensis]|uniref:P-loop containing nucleoside triphosphate hydrolase protein n=1 Tax=Ceraceosorus guamensis TaxID=1522189 RepID=A0A316W336_9BASI|nr:P-loop containing nucleoside triphosphate hydrolase protein [Ceraceosorus guamensis]PWN44307.1 P-loop containing nucleoside triphosphate hydrolase protein [Ceraceosorus guamensis]